MAPIKGSTIPKLELSGAQLLSRVLKQVKIELQEKLSIDKIYGWLDSTVVFCWLKNDNKTYKQFVENRVLEIRENKDINWKLIDTKENPADDVSRGLFLTQIINNKRWLEGPQSLSKAEKFWPNLKPGDSFSNKNSTEETVNLYSGSYIEYSSLTDEEKISCLVLNPDINLVVFDKVQFVSEYNDNLEIEDLCEIENSHNTGKYNRVLGQKFSILNSKVSDVKMSPGTGEYNRVKRREENITETNCYVNRVDEPTLTAIIDPNRFSSLSRLLNVTAKVFEFIRKLKRKVEENKMKNNLLNNKRPQAEEIDDLVKAKKIWIMNSTLR